MSTLVDRLNESIELFAAYEQEIRFGQYEAAFNVIRDLQKRLSTLQEPPNGVENSAEQIRRMVDLKYAPELADNVRLALAAYQPYGQSKALKHLHQRQVLVGQLRRLAEVVARLFPPNKTPEEQPALPATIVREESIHSDA